MEKEKPFIDKIFSKEWIPFAIILSLGFVIYFQTFFFGFSYLDDNNLILDNRYFLSNLGNFFKSFSIDVFHIFNHSAFYYRPILTNSLLFDYQIGGISPFIYHFTNVGLHLFASCLLFVFLKKLNYKKELSFLFATIFLVHPVLTQAVSWIPGRNDSLLAVFILLTFIFFIKYLGNEKIKDIFWALFFFMVSLFTKESAVFILPLIIYYLYFIYKKRDEKISPKNFYFLALALGIMVFWFFVRHLVLRDSVGITFVDMIYSIYLNFPAIIQFLGKIFFPFNLSVLPIIQDTTFVYGIISAVLLTLLILFTKIRRWNYILFGFGWFFAFLIPSFIRPNPLLIADFIEHRLYVPLIGFFIILLETDIIKWIDLKKKIVLGIVGALIFILSIITIVHSRNFSNRISFWENAVKNSPHYPLGHRNLGAMYFLDGDMDNAEKEFTASLELNPNEEMAHNNLGLVYANKNKFVEAEAEYKKELEINPYYDNAYFNLGLLYFRQERYEEAENSWKKTLEINPDFVDAINALAVFYYNQKDYEKTRFYAKELYKRGISIPPEVLKIIQLSTIMTK